MAGKLGNNIKPTSVKDAAKADVIILAVPFGSVSEAVSGISDWTGRVVIDATNAIDFPAFTPKDLRGRLSTEIVAEAVPGAHVVKAFNTLPAAVLATDPVEDGGNRVVFLSGNDAEANTQVADLRVSLASRL